MTTTRTALMGRVVLAHVDAVGLGRDGKVGPVVHDEQRAVLVGDVPEHLRRVEHLLIARLLVAQLHHVDAARERRAQERLRTPVADEVEPGACEAVATIAHDGEVWQLAWDVTGAHRAERAVCQGGRAKPDPD